MISRYFAGVVGDEFPEILNMSYKKVEHLRYGENSQQAAIIWRLFCSKIIIRLWTITW